jgi:hypothetical protein
VTDAWQPGKTYPPGSLVRPRATPPVVRPNIPNPDFETGDWTGWTQAPGWTLSQNAHYSGAWSLQLAANAGQLQDVVSTNKVPVNVGQGIRAQVMVQQGAASSGDAGAVIKMVWYDDDGNEVSRSQGSDVHSGSGGHWNASTGYLIAPQGASQAAIAIGGWNNSNDLMWVDYVTWDYAYAGPPAGLVYKATQAAPGKSGSTEPAWPPVLGQTVQDNQVTWEGVIATRLVWEAVPLLKSGDTEPTWPEGAGSHVRDGTINWEAISRRIEDVKCPQSKVVAIMASKIFAADGDIVRFSATVNPLDWSTAQDAGYLPTGLQQANANDMAVLAPYRSNLTAFNASSFQNWQVDPDPTAMSLLDQMEGIGSTWQHAAQPVGNELYYLSQLGVRSVSIAAGTDSLSAGDVGMPIDALVRPAVKQDASLLGPRAIYFPSAGQYWLACRSADNASSQTFVYSLSGSKGKWSRYTFPWAVDAFAQLGNDLYIRHGDEVSVVSEDVATDDTGDQSVPFAGAAQWHWLDCGASGTTKMLESVDYVGTGQAPSLSVGYDQRNLDAFTEPYAIDADTLTGGPIPIPVAAPTLSLRLDFAGGAPWTVNAVILHVDDLGGPP